MFLSGCSSLCRSLKIFFLSSKEDFLAASSLFIMLSERLFAIFCVAFSAAVWTGGFGAGAGLGVGLAGGGPWDCVGGFGAEPPNQERPPSGAGALLLRLGGAAVLLVEALAALTSVFQKFAYFDFAEAFVLDREAAGGAVGCVLLLENIPLKKLPLGERGESEDLAEAAARGPWLSLLLLFGVPDSDPYQLPGTVLEEESFSG